MSNSKSAAFFDLDNTLYDGFFGEALFRHHIKHKMNLGALIKYFASHYPLLPLSKLGLYPYEKAYDKWGSDLSWLLKGIEISRAEKIWTWIANNLLIPNVRPSMRKAVTQHKSDGLKIIFVSGSFEEIVIKLSNEFCADDIIATKMETANNRYTGNIIQPLNVGREKLIRIKDYAHFHALDLSRSYFYSDSIVDLPAMELVGNPVAVHPDKDLLTAAKSRGWTVIINKGGKTP